MTKRTQLFFFAVIFIVIIYFNSCKSFAPLIFPEWSKPLIENSAYQCSMPFTLDGCNIIVEVEIGGKKYYFIIDSGCSSTSMDYDIAKSVSKVKAGSFLFLLPLKTAKIPSIKVGNLLFNNEKVVVFKKDKWNWPEQVTGLLGCDFLQKVSVTIDYEKDSVYLNMPGFIPDNYDGIIPLLTTKKAPLEPNFNVKINGVDGIMLFDMGNQFPDIFISTLFQKSNKSIFDSVQIKEGYPWKIKRGLELQLDSLLFSDVTAYLLTEQDEPYETAGNIGCNLFMRLKSLTIDYSNEKLYYELKALETPPKR